MSDTEPIPEAMSADPSDSIRAEVEQEYAGKLAQAELRAHAAQAGITLPEGFTGYLDSSRLLGDDGNPSAEAIAKVLEPFQTEKEPLFPQIAGVGRSRSDSYQYQGPRVSLDARHRK